MTTTGDVRVSGIQPLDSPADLLAALPLTGRRASLVARARDAVHDVLTGRDDRLVVVVGPCSIHDPVAALDYAGRLAREAERHSESLLVVMRVYFEKPRTTVGWTGLINDPGLDGGHDVSRGMRTARQLLCDILDTGLPVGCEFLDPITPQFIADAVSWGAIGARTTESQVHRHMASGLSMPVGFKNGTDGGLQATFDACRTAANGHTFFGVDQTGRASVVSTTGNPDCHVVLRGGQDGPNYGPQQVDAALTGLGRAGLPRRLMIDASHANSGKDHERQPGVARGIADQVRAGQNGIVGVMLESFIAPGRQDLLPGAALTYGQSVTDACMGWETTAVVLDELAAARDRS